MLVSLCEVSTSPPHTGSTATPPPYFQLILDHPHATVVDVTDTRARARFLYDVDVPHIGCLFPTVVQPLIHLLTHEGGTSSSSSSGKPAPQAVCMVDGSADVRQRILFENEDGLLSLAVSALRNSSAVQSVYLSAITPMRDHSLRDDLRQRREDDHQQPKKLRSPITVYEDEEEHFTAVENATFAGTDDVHVWESTLHHLRQHSDDHHHQVLSLLILFHPFTQRPNATLQFISLSSEGAKMPGPSTRHALHKIATLIECQSPSIHFSASPLTQLLRPALLGWQPSVYVATMSPTTTTFPEAFAVAQMASKMHHLRNGTSSTWIHSIMKQHHLGQDHHPTTSRLTPTTTPLATVAAAQVEQMVPDDVRAYTNVMEEGMKKLRLDLESYSMQLQQQHQHDSLGASLHERVERAEGRADRLEEELHRLRQSKKESGDGMPVAPRRSPLVVEDDEVGAELRGWDAKVHQREVEASTARLSELVKMIAYHQQELKEAHEEASRYRERILQLEDVSRVHEEEVERLRRLLEEKNAELRGAQRRLDARAAEKEAHHSSADERRMTEMQERLARATASLDVERERRREAQAALTAAQERLRDASDADFLVAQLKHSYEAQVEELQREVQQLRCAARVPTNTSSGAFIGTPRAADASPASASKPSQSSRKSFEEYMREKPAYRLRR